MEIYQQLKRLLLSDGSANFGLAVESKNEAFSVRIIVRTVDPSAEQQPL
jgi:hypothetical protein